MKHFKPQHFWYLVKITLLFITYFLTASIGLSLDAVSGFAALVWPPTGIALAAILILGYRYWPGITLAAFLVNIVVGAPPLVAFGIAIGNTLEAVLGAYGLKRWVQFQNSLDRVNDVLGLVLIAGIASTAVSATIGVSSLLLGGVIPTTVYGATWTAWWVGDMLGALVIAPFLLVWSNFRRMFIPRRLAEAAVLALLLCAVSIFAFRGFPLIGIQPFTFIYITFPFLVLIALRFGQPGSVSALVLVLLVAIWNTAEGIGPFAGSRLSESLLLLQSFMAVAAVTFMTLAAAISERERTLERQHQLMQEAALLTQQRSRLLAINQAKDEFIYLASHQLRTPATVVKQYVGMLIGEYAGKLTKPQRAMLEHAYESNERQIQVINDLLGVAQIDAGNVDLQKEEVDVVALVTKVLQNQRPFFDERQQSCSFIHRDEDFIVYADKKKLEMVLENIIENASKYTLPGKKIEVRLSKGKDELSISIKDEGIGMAPQDMKRLFKKFSRIDNPLSIAVGGTGLGLYWARKIMDLHNGSITVSSRLNHGSTFTITLPRARETED